MANGLDKQIYIYSLGTYSFHNDEENQIFKKMQNLKGYKKRLSWERSQLIKEEKEGNLTKDEKVEIKETKKGIREEIAKLNVDIAVLKKKLHKTFDEHKGIRTLRKEEMKNNNVISIFDSVLTRTLELEEGNDNKTEDIMIIQSYHLQVYEDLIKKGYYHNNEKYIYFSSSAGMIRQKKGLWIKEKLWIKHKNTLMCGLDIDKINELGGCNINKYLSYKSLIFSASTEWTNFGKIFLNHSIVVDDLEMDVFAKVNYIDRDTYEISPNKEMDVPLTATDGVGMILPSISKKNFMVRLPWLKGLLASWDFLAHLDNPNTSPIVEDIYGKEWDIKKDKIWIIFTRSQFKMASYFSSWQEYKDNFIKYKCQAAKLNEEEDEFNDGKLGYQMLQSLTDVSDEELSEIASSTVYDIENIGTKDVMLKVLGATEANKRKKSFQKSLLMYPELLNDNHSKEAIKAKKKSLVLEARTGKLNVNGSFTFIIPDLYGFCEFLFEGNKKPVGLLKENEVYCKLHDSGKVGILRSPHLSREWGIKDNVIDEEKSKWFTTEAIYVSNLSVLSRLIQNDWDGDRVLVLSGNKDKTLIEVAERNMENDKIVPLYYIMEKAKPQIIDHNNIFNSLKLAFESSGAIGRVSNSIAKVWSSETPNLDVIAWATMEANFEVDYAKTLFKLKRPQHVDEQIKKYVNTKLPHFFIYDKKKINQKKQKKIKQIRVQPNNNSTINRLGKIIKSPNINFEEVAGGKFDYKLLMKDPKVELDQEIIKRYTELDRNKKDLLKNYNEDNKKKKGKRYVYKLIELELLKINEDIEYVTDVLVKYLFEIKDSKFKDTLWESFGEVIEENLKKNLSEAKHCEDCDSKFRKAKIKTRCDECQKKKDRENARLRKKKQREKEISLIV